MSESNGDFNTRITWMKSITVDLTATEIFFTRDEMLRYASLSSPIFMGI